MRVAGVGDLEAAVGPPEVPSRLGSTPGPATGLELASSGGQALAHDPVHADVAALSPLKLYSVALDAPPGNGLPAAARTVELPAVSEVTVTGPVGHSRRREGVPDAEGRRIDEVVAVERGRR